MRKGLSSSAAVCVLVVKCFADVYDIELDMATIMELAYLGQSCVKLLDINDSLNDLIIYLYDMYAYINRGNEDTVEMRSHGPVCGHGSGKYWVDDIQL